MKHVEHFQRTNSKWVRTKKKINSPSTLHNFHRLRCIGFFYIFDIYNALLEWDHTCLSREFFEVWALYLFSRSFYFLLHATRRFNTIAFIREQSVTHVLVVAVLMIVTDIVIIVQTDAGNTVCSDGHNFRGYNAKTRKLSNIFFKIGTSSTRGTWRENRSDKLQRLRDWANSQRKEYQNKQTLPLVNSHHHFSAIEADKRGQEQDRLMSRRSELNGFWFQIRKCAQRLKTTKRLGQTPTDRIQNKDDKALTNYSYFGAGLFEVFTVDALPPFVSGIKFPNSFPNPFLP